MTALRSPRYPGQWQPPARPIWTPAPHVANDIPHAAPTSARALEILRAVQIWYDTARPVARFPIGLVRIAIERAESEAGVALESYQ